MLRSGFRSERLRVNLRLVINRLKLLEKKKTELAQKARKEIADYLASGKDERARIRVEHIIREDYLVEAMEILELYCDLLLARFGMIQSMKDAACPAELLQLFGLNQHRQFLLTQLVLSIPFAHWIEEDHTSLADRELDTGLSESISTLIWAAPRLQTEVVELRTVSDQLCAKYSKEYGKLCRTNQIGTVNERLMLKLSVEAPPKILVERYLIEIAKNYNVPYEPDSVVMGEIPVGVEADLIDVVNEDKKGGPGGGGGGGGGGGFTAPTAGIMSMPVPPVPFSYPPRKDDFNGLSVDTYQPFNNFQPPNIGGNPPPLPMQPPTYESIDDVRCTDTHLPSSKFPGPSAPTAAPRKTFGPAPPGPSDFIYDNMTLPELPSVPDTLPATSVGGTSTASEDIDFDDLSRRFEDLKKKT